MAMSRLPVYGLIIDLDDTLYPLGRYRHSGFAAVASYVSEHFGIAADSVFAFLSRAAATGEGATAFQALCRRFNLGPETVPVLVEVSRAHRPDIFLGHGALMLLRGLRAGGWGVAVLTNGLPSVQALKVEALGLDELVDHVIYADRIVEGGKPNPAAFNEALHRLGTAADRTVCVGDDPRTDIAGARAAGLASIRLAVTDVAVDHGTEADIVVHSLDEVPAAASALVEGVSRRAA